MIVNICLYIYDLSISKKVSRFWVLRISIGLLKYEIQQTFKNNICIVELFGFGYCKGGTSFMRKYDWSTLDMGKI